MEAQATEELGRARVAAAASEKARVEEVIRTHVRRSSGSAVRLSTRSARAPSVALPLVPGRVAAGEPIWAAAGASNTVAVVPVGDTGRPGTSTALSVQVSGGSSVSDGTAPPATAPLGGHSARLSRRSLVLDRLRRAVGTAETSGSAELA